MVNNGGDLLHRSLRSDMFLVLNAYSAELSPDDLDSLTKSPDVKMIVPDTLVYPTTLLTQYVSLFSS